MNSLHLSLTLTHRLLKFSPTEPLYLFQTCFPLLQSFFFSFSLHLNAPLDSLSCFPPFSLSFSSFVLWFFSLPHLCPSITVCSFTSSQGALYPPDTMPSIHITSRDTDTNYLKGTYGCTTPWSRGWRENGDKWTESLEKYGKRDRWRIFNLVWCEHICRRSGKVTNITALGPAVGNGSSIQAG